MSQRNYTNFAKTAAPSSSIASGDTSIDVDTQTDYPDSPYIITVFEGGETPPAAPKKEVMRATSVTENGDGTFTLDVERDIDGYNAGGESFTTNATVQHVSIADEVGPTRRFTQGNLLYSPQNVYAYDDFSDDATKVDGKSLPSGQTWDAGSGFSIENGVLKATGVDQEALISRPSQFFRIKSHIKITGDKDEFGIVFYQDADNWALVGPGIDDTTGNLENLRFIYSDAGTVNTQVETESFNARFKSSFGVLEVVTAKDSFGDTQGLYASIDEETISSFFRSNTALKSIMSNAEKVGFKCFSNGGLKVTGFQLIDE